MARKPGQDGDEGEATRQVRAVDLLADTPGRGTAGAGAAWSPPDEAARATGSHASVEPARVPARHRILPRSLLGITALILSFSVGAGLSGVVLYSYYQYRLNQTNDRVNTLINGYKQQFANAEGDLKSTAASAKSDIQAQLGPIQALEASPQTLATLAKQLAPSVFFVHTLDANGQASVGTAFVVSSSTTQSLLLTSYTTVAATTRSPAPAVYVRQGETDTQVTVRTWDPSYDLALIVLPRGNLPVVTVAPSSPAPQAGERLYAVSGLGSAGAAVSQGSITDVSASGIQHDAPLGAAYQGGPLVDQNGQVVAISSRTYAPLGFTTDSVWYAPYVQAACNKVLVCPNGDISNAQ